MIWEPLFHQNFFYDSASDNILVVIPETEINKEMSNFVKICTKNNTVLGQEANYQQSVHMLNP